MSCTIAVGATFAQSDSTGDVNAGKALAATCVACHGPAGISSIPSYPSLAGQSRQFLFKQLVNIRDGLREAPLMVGQLTGKSDDDLLDIAAYYNSLKPGVGSAKASLAERGAQIYYGGTSAGVPMCSACHAVDGLGLSAAGYPLLAGQQATYLENRLNAYANLGDLKDGDSRILMRDIARRMTHADKIAVSSYLSGLRQQ